MPACASDRLICHPGVWPCGSDALMDCGTEGHRGGLDPPNTHTSSHLAAMASPSRACCVSSLHLSILPSGPGSGEDDEGPDLLSTPHVRVLEESTKGNIRFSLFILPPAQKL